MTESPPLLMKDSRRLTGPNMIWDHPGAVIDVAGEDSSIESLIDAWKTEARRILKAVGFDQETTGVRRFQGGASLALSAPIDALYAATEVNEWAFHSACKSLGFDTGETPVPPIAEATDQLRSIIEEERNPALLALRQAAVDNQVAFLTDDDEASIGMGIGSRRFEVSDLPDPNDLDWSTIHNIPVALVTGTNGKTTTVRLLSAMAKEAGHVYGCCSTDGILVNGKVVSPGDYSGPGGARTVLRHPDVTLAILETARGGLLRRGLGVGENPVSCSLVTNIGADHLGEFGVADLDALADTKLIVRRAVKKPGRLILNADDPILSAKASALDLPLAWFTLKESHPLVEPHVARGGTAAWIEEKCFWLSTEGKIQKIGSVNKAPITYNGAAHHNMANALSAILVASHLGLSSEEIKAGLASFENTPEQNPGRGNLFHLGGVQILVDFAHNPHGCEALITMASKMPAERRLIILGQAGDRDNESILEMVRVCWNARPDRILVKEMLPFLRGREPGEIPALIHQELTRVGAPEDAIGHAGSELEAIHEALAWAKPGDLLLLLVHAERKAVLELMAKLEKEGWKPRHD